MSSGGRHYIPEPDSAMDAWGENLRAWLELHHDEVGLSESDYGEVKAAYIDWHTAFTAHTAARAAAEAARQAKDAARAAFEAAVRPRVRIAQAFPGTTAAARAAMGVSLRGGPAPRAALPGGPATAPTVSLIPGPRLVHTLRFADASTPTRRAKPRGVHAAEVWVKVGDTPPAGPLEMRYMGIATSAPHRLAFRPEEGGQTAYYWLRWIDAVGGVGPWSEMAAGTIAA